MAADEKDRLGDKLREAERGREDAFFAERDRQLVEQMRRAKEHQDEAEIKKLVHMRCPKCGDSLRERTVHNVSVHECPRCHGMWLDQGELQEIARQDPEGHEGWIARWLKLEFPKD